MLKNKDDFSKYMDAADAVCLECVKCSDEVCDTCPVRQTIDYYHKQLDNIPALVGLHPMSDRERYNLQQEIMETTADAYMDF